MTIDTYPFNLAVHIITSYHLAITDAVTETIRLIIILLSVPFSVSLSSGISRLTNSFVGGDRCNCGVGAYEIPRDRHTGSLQLTVCPFTIANRPRDSTIPVGNTRIIR